MFRISLDSKTKIISMFVAGVVVGLSLPASRVKGDIITDIEELEKERDPTKKPEKKKDAPKLQPDESKAEGQTTVPPSGTKKQLKPKVPVTEAIDPEKQMLIPEPIDETGAQTPVTKPIELKSAKGKSKVQRQKSPIRLQSDGTTSYSQDKLTVILQKNVMITQGDLRLQSNEATVTFLPKNSADSGVKTAVLDGKVSITRYSTDPTERMNAKSDKATFDNVQQQVTLDGNARLWRAGDLVRGERIVYDLTSGMIKIDKAQGVVQPDRTKK